MKNLILAVQFLTRLPININLRVEENAFAKSVVFFPLVGLIIGLFDFGIYYAVSFLSKGILPVASCVLANAMITGALHVDGLADTCDGIFSSRKRDKMLEIMKDSRIGTNGTIAIFFDFILRIALLLSLKDKLIIFAIVLSPIISRSILVFLMQISSYARKNGLGGLFIGKQSQIRTIIALVICSTLLFGVIGYMGILFLLITIIMMLLYRVYIYSKIGGMTGDTIGAANELTELLFMFLMLAAGKIGLL